MELPGLTLEDFFARRARTLEDLASARGLVDHWWEERRESTATLQQLAELEGLLELRRQLLTDLLHLDDRMLTTLIKLRRGAGDGEGTMPHVPNPGILP